MRTLIIVALVLLLCLTAHAALPPHWIVVSSHVDRGPAFYLVRLAPVEWSAKIGDAKPFPNKQQADVAAACATTSSSTATTRTTT